MGHGTAADTIAAPDDIIWRVIDGPAVQVAELELQIRSGRSRAVLACLVLRHGRPVSLERLVDALWGDAPPRSARNSVQRFVSDLRRDLGPVADRIVTAPGGYVFAPASSDVVDVIDLETRRRVARNLFNRDDHESALAELEGGPDPCVEPLLSLGDSDFLALERIRMQELLLELFELQQRCRLRLAEFAETIDDGLRVAAAHPYREALWQQVIHAQLALGKEAAATQTFDRLRRVLADELDVPPSLGLEDLRERATRQTLVEVAQTHADVPETVSAPSLFGRGTDTLRIAERLARQRIVTIVGPGGVGKSALAAEVARMVVATTRKPCNVVELAPHQSADVVAAIGAEVGGTLSATGQGLHSIIERLGSEPRLLVLDNAEHVRAEVSDFLDSLVEHPASGAGLSILVTSRSPVGARGESVVRLDPLDQATARQLLEQRLEDGGIELGLVTDAEVDSLIELLDGLPLAVELAASALRVAGIGDLVRTPSAIELLVDRSEPAGSRHRSMEAAISFSLQSVDDAACSALLVLAHFGGGCGLDALTDALAQPTGWVLEALTAPIDQSLVHLERSGGDSRYRLLVPIREHLLRHLPAPDLAALRRLEAHFVGLVEQRLDEIKGEQPAAAVGLLRRELPNLQWAFGRAAERGDNDAMIRLVGALGLATGIAPEIGAQATLRGWSDRLAVAAEMMPVPEAHRAEVARCWGSYGSGDASWYEQVQGSLTDDPAIRALAAIGAFSEGRSAQGWAAFDASEAVGIADPYLRALACGCGAVIAVENAHPDAAKLADVAAATARGSRSPGIRFFGLMGTASLAFASGEFDRAERLMDQMLSTVEGQGLVALENLVLASSAMSLGYLVERRDPVPILERVFANYLAQNALDPASVAMTLDTAILVLKRRGREGDAAHLLGLATRLNLSIGVLRGPRTRFEQTVDASHALRTERTAARTANPIEVLRRTHEVLARLA